MSSRRWIAGLAGISLLAAALVIALSSRPPSGGATALMCPEATSNRVFHDPRRFCATEATALARIDGDGMVTYLADAASIPCRIPAFEVLSENSTRVGGPSPTCDTDTIGDTLYVFARCSLRMNYPSDTDFRPRLPIGLLAENNPC